MARRIGRQRPQNAHAEGSDKVSRVLLAHGLGNNTQSQERQLLIPVLASLGEYSVEHLASHVRLIPAYRDACLGRKIYPNALTWHRSLYG